MARIAESDLERIKREVSLEQLVSARVKLSRHGSNLIGLCPFHDDREPSLVISSAKNLWNCLGACQTGGTVIDWVMKTEGVSFRHAVELLRQDVPLSSSSKPSLKVSTVPKLCSPITEDADDAAALRQVVDFYRETYASTPAAAAYLEGRGLSHPKLAQTFELGFSNRTLGYRLPKPNRQSGAVLRGRLQRLGVLRKSGHEHLNGSVVVPLFHEDGRVSNLYGRKISSALRKGTPLHLYLPGPRAGVFNWAGLSNEDVILCESVLDALTFWCAGFSNVTTSYGTCGFTEDLHRALLSKGVRRVLIAYDRDEAGGAAADKLAPVLAADGLSAYRVVLPKGMDVNAYAQKMSPAKAALQLVIDQAKWMAGPKHSRVSVAPDASPKPPPAPPAAIEPSASTSARKPPSTLEPEVRDHELLYRFGARTIRVRGLSNNKSYDVLKVNLFVAEGDRFFVDTVDLYQARQRVAFLTHASTELELPHDLLKSELGQVMLSLEARQAESLSQGAPSKPSVPELSPEEREAALSLLRDPQLLDRIVSDFERLGVVGEQTNKLVGYVATVSRKLERPLAVIVQSSSAAGKSSLMEAVLAMVPEEERIKYSAMTGQSLYYLGETDLKHKILAIVEEEGAERASYALKLLQSEGELTIASTGKDPVTGQLKTNAYRVEGPVMIFLTTTAIEIDEELLNRCLVLTVDEGRAQTAAIHAAQRKSRTLEGLFGQRGRHGLLSLHNNAQRLLRALPVVNPYADRLTFCAHKTRLRRDHTKYLTLIDAIALLRQYQRPTKTATVGGQPVEYVEVAPDDIAVANRLAHQVLGRTLDELPPQTRRLLQSLQAMVKMGSAKEKVPTREYRFTRRALREHLGQSDTQVRLHLGRLVEMEYVVVHRGSRGQTYVYELVYTDDVHAQGAMLSGLIDPSTLTTSTSRGKARTSRGGTDNLAGGSRGQRGGSAGSSRLSEMPVSLPKPRPNGASGGSVSKKRTSGSANNGASYVHPPAKA